MERGLFRLWLVGSLVWIALSGWAYQTSGESLSDPSVTAIMFGFPLGAGLLLAALIWAFRGFSR